MFGLGSTPGTDRASRVAEGPRCPAERMFQSRRSGAVHLPHPMVVWRRDSSHTRTVTPDLDADFTAQLSKAMREHDLLEPLLSESHWDENYWTDASEAVAAAVGGSRKP